MELSCPPVLNRFPLTPYDRMFLASHLAQQRRGLPGHPLLAWLDVRGRLDRAALVAGIRRAMAAVPHTTAKIGYSRLTARAHWRLCGSHLDPVPLEFHDLRAELDPMSSDYELRQRTIRVPLDPGSSPQVRLIDVQLADDHHRLVLHWPHYLMDLEGAQMFLTAIGSAARHAELDRGSIESDEYPVAWSRRYVRRWAQGMLRSRRLTRIDSTVFAGQCPSPADGTNFTVRSWSPEATERIANAARNACAPGPLRYTRFYMMALLQALDELHGGRALYSRDHYVLPLPMLRPCEGPRRVIARNDLTIATLVIHRRLLERPRELDAALIDQIRAYTEAGQDEATWALMTYAGWLRSRHYQWMLERQRTFPRYSIGFTTFRADDWAGGFLGCRVENFNVCGMPPIPPGVIASFCRMGSRLNLSLSYYSHMCPPQLAERLTARIEHHLGISNSSTFGPRSMSV